MRISAGYLNIESGNLLMGPGSDPFNMVNVRSDLKSGSTSAEARVAAVITTYKRQELLERMIRSLATESQVSMICVIDNGCQQEMKPSLEKLDARVRYVNSGKDLGRGGGLARGFEEAMADKSITHLWILDDDAVIIPGCTQCLIETMELEKADVATPLLGGPDGNTNAVPGPLKGKAWDEIRKRITPDEFVAKCGNGPFEFVWAPAVALLVTRRAVEQVGLPRVDYWLMGEDIEYSCRLTAKFKGILVAKARTLHLNPTGPETEMSKRYGFVKFCAFLINLSYTTVYLPHGRKVLKQLPGNYFRFMRIYGWSFSNLLYALRCFSWGIIRRMPAGSEEFQKFKDEYMQVQGG